MHGGGTSTLASRLIGATPAFEWFREGSFLCGVRKEGPWCIVKSERVLAGEGLKMRQRYMQGVTIRKRLN